MALFGKKKEDASAPGMPDPSGMPPQDMGAPPGMPDPSGMPPVEGMPPPGAPPDQGMPPGGADYGQPQGYDQGAYPPEQPPQGMPMEAPPSGPPQHMGGEGVEEIAEQVVEEKWKEKKKEIDKLIEWKEEVNTKLEQFKQEMADLKASFDNLHKGVLGKITEYDENLTNVGTEIKAMEKVFSKVLPSLTDSVNKLQRYSGTAPVKKKS